MMQSASGVDAIGNTESSFLLTGNSIDHHHVEE